MPRRKQKPRTRIQNARSAILDLNGPESAKATLDRGLSAGDKSVRLLQEACQILKTVTHSEALPFLKKVRPFLDGEPK